MTNKTITSLLLDADLIWVKAQSTLASFAPDLQRRLVDVTVNQAEGKRPHCVWPGLTWATL